MVMTLLSCGNELVSCDNDFANLWERVSILWLMTLLTCENELVSCGNDFANLWK